VVLLYPATLSSQVRLHQFQLLLYELHAIRFYPIRFSVIGRTHLLPDLTATIKVSCDSNKNSNDIFFDLKVLY